MTSAAERRAAIVTAVGFLLLVIAAAFWHPALSIALLGVGLMLVGLGVA